MRKTRVLAARALAVGAGVAAGSASAGVMVIDFEEFDLPPNEPIAFLPEEPVSVGEFLFTPLELTDSHYGNAVEWWGYNGTHVTGYHKSVLMEREDGGAFDLIAFDYAGFPQVEFPLVTVTASNGSSVDLFADGQSDGPGGVEDFETFVLPDGFTGITSATFDVPIDWHLDNVAWALPGVCPWDVDDDGVVGITDLLALLAKWGPCPGCPSDFDNDGDVGITDLLKLLANWGFCP